MNEYSIYIKDFKRRSAMEQAMINWSRKNLQGRKPFRIAEARQRLLLVLEEFRRIKVRGAVTIGQPKVTGTWTDGTVACIDLHVHATGRKLPSLVITESYAPGILKA